MPEFTPTASQADAINARNGAILVSAGAGSGKTKVLTERLMGYITDREAPADLDSFLIITFTRAAAGELRGRITEELARRLAEDPANRRLRRQSALCQRAQIGTIDSFCSTILRENCHLAGLSPDFKVADDERAASMKGACLDRLLDAYYDEPDAHPGFSYLADTAGAGRDDARLAGLVLKLHEKMQSHARPEKWAREQVALLNSGETDLARTPWGREILERVGASAEYWADEMECALKAMSGYPEIYKAYANSFSQTADEIRELSRCTRLGWDKTRECLPVSFPKLGALRNSPAPEVSDFVKARRGACKDAMKRFSEMLYAPSDKLLSEMALTAPAMQALLQLTLDFDAAFSKEKRRRGLVDYADLEHLTAKLLTDDNGDPTPLAVSISTRYTEIMVDEYQDVSRVQDTIFRAISRNGANLFMVGDVKQSIYRFRLADPGIFTEKYLSYKDSADASPGEPRRILLRENFRSRREILDAANSVFSSCMSRSLGDIDYDEAAALICGAPYTGSGSVPEIHLMELPESGDEETPDKTALEAAYVARRIQNMVASGATVTDHGTQRPMEYGDVAILLRSANTVGPIYRRELARIGVPVASGQGGGFFSSIEVSVVMSLLAITDNPHQDIPLIAVLRSPAFGFDANELSAIRARDKEHDFYTALCLASEDDAKCRAFLDTLGKLRAYAPDAELAEFIWYMYGLCELPALCSAMSDGETRRTNLMLIFELARQFENSGYRGLHRFVLWLRRMAQKGQEPSAGAASASAVQIMSVHKSKGLEFPVVFLCDTARQFNRQDSRETVLIHPELGLGPKLTDIERRVEYPTLARNAIKLRIDRESLSEEMRLMYVAMTRPKERLFITAAVKNAGDFVAKCAVSVTEPMAAEVLAQAASPLCWLVQAALADRQRHIKIIPCEPFAQDGDADEADGQSCAADETLVSDIAEKLAFCYPYASAVTLPSKVTATELKGSRDADEDAQDISPKSYRPFRAPRLGAGKLTGKSRGTATHLVMQYMDFSKGTTLDGVQSEIERMRRARYLSDAEAESVDAGAIHKFIIGELGQRILHADSVRREFKFSLLWDAEEIFSAGEGEQVLMQGVVDCFIVEDGRLTVIDYKTDNVRTPEEIEARARLYAGQISTYAKALHRMTGLEVRQCALYFLVPGKTVYIILNSNKTV